MRFLTLMLSAAALISTANPALACGLRLGTPTCGALATNFLLAARLSSARVLTRSEMPTELSSFGAASKAADALGGVKIFLPRPGLTGPEIASDLIGADSQACKGKFASAR
jgi:hypothetical protein